MICNTCGRYKQNEEANFCEYCGTSFRDGNANEIKTPGNNPTYQNYTTDGSSFTPPPRQEALNVNPKEKTVTFLDWLGTYLIMFIPIVGGIVFLIMLFIWSFGNSVSDSKKNWARATLIFYLIMIVLIIIFMIISLGMIDNPLFNNMMDIESNELYNLLKEYR
ncbi:MAG: hypothetical protein GX321_02565 [Clostridiales bacterium]|nr:hypothetical protein [Clostridiales bacterium]